MNESLFISFATVTILVIIGLILTMVVFKRKKEGKIGEPKYQVFFILGITWIPIGIVFMVAINLVLGIAFMGMGVIYMAIGLVNRDKWEINRRKMIEKLEE